MTKLRGRSAGNAAQGEPVTRESPVTQVSETEEVQTAKAAKAHKKQERQKKAKPSEQTLDTSQLLKKKDDRNV